MYKFESKVEIEMLNLDRAKKDLNITLKKIDKGYSIKKDKFNVELSYSSDTTLRRAISLVIANENIDSFEIAFCDKEGMLGIMLDCSRNAVASVAHVKDFILNIASLGFNTLMLYTEDTYEVENERYFGHLRGKYSISELSEIVQFGKKYSVELIPCIQTLAHLNQIFRWADYANLKDCEDILLIDNEHTYQLIENMLRSLREVFITEKINIGMDEAHAVGLGRYLIEHGFVDRTNLILNHLNKVIKLCRRYNFNNQFMWSDMLLRLSSNGEYYGRNELPDYLKNIIPDGVTLVYWDYYSLDTDLYDRMLKKHEILGNDIVFASGAWKWKGFTPSNLHSMKANNYSMPAIKTNKIKDVWITMWGDNGAECSNNMVFPTLIQMSNKYYETHEKYGEPLCEYLTGIDFDSFLSLDKADKLFDGFDDGVLTNNTKFLFYADILQGMFDATLKEEYIHGYKENSLRLKKNAHGKYSYLFKTLQDLTEFLSLKVQIILRLSDAYLKRDMEKLAHIMQDMVRLIELGKVFYESFKAQWMNENKPFGFEVHDIRIGGMLFRVEQNIKSINDLVNGKVRCIEELDAPRLNPFGNRENDEMKAEDSVFNDYRLNVSANII